jgi:hypothetical protein
MPDDFIGDLSKVRLLDLVRPLLNGKKSGMLKVKAEDIGEIHIEAGSIIHARTGCSTDEEAILGLMEWNSGRVTFDWETTTVERTVSMPTERLVQSWISREEEWKKIREVVPSSSSTFAMSTDGPQENLSIHGEQWKVLALCNGSRAVAEIAETLQWDEFKTSKLISQMVRSGLLAKIGEKPQGSILPQRKYVNGTFFPFVEQELKKIMGPIAPIIIDDQIADLGQSREQFPEELVQPLVQSLSEEINDDVKRASFATTIAKYFSQKQL